jgi:sulfite exporter TauE/SafE
MGSLFLLGGLNGLLPCGLVYVACAAAAATGGVLGGLEFMLLFGLGTAPMMLGLSLAGGMLHTALRVRLQKLIPVCIGIVAVLLVLRGLSLGIPYVSPDLSGNGGGPACCVPAD